MLMERGRKGVRRSAESAPDAAGGGGTGGPSSGPSTGKAGEGALVAFGPQKQAVLISLHVKWPGGD